MSGEDQRNTAIAELDSKFGFGVEPLQSLSNSELVDLCLPLGNPACLSGILCASGGCGINEEEATPETEQEP